MDGNNLFRNLKPHTKQYLTNRNKFNNKHNKSDMDIHNDEIYHKKGIWKWTKTSLEFFQ